jgi:hypothetical protein
LKSADAILGVVPYTRNNKFVGREQLVKSLTAKFTVKEGSQARLALFGLGGVGSVFLPPLNKIICLTGTENHK